MASDARTFLAASVFNDGNIVSYRTLSREAKVHSNVAKKMLYDFHQQQTSKHPGSVHATYLIDGVHRTTHDSDIDSQQKDGEDMHMQSSPCKSSPMLQEDNGESGTYIRTIVLAREEDLTMVKLNIEPIHSIHIYSLEPSSVERRSGPRPEVTTVPVFGGNEQVTGKSQERNRASIKSVQIANRPLSSGKAGRPTPQSNSKILSKTAILKREQSDIFKSFSKPTAKLKRDDTGSSTGPSSAPSAAHPDDKTVDEDGPMSDASEDEQVEDFIAANKDSAKQRKSHSEREADLRTMMDEEDMEDTVTDPFPKPAPIDAPVWQTEPSPKPPVVVVEGRRRSRRKVMKKQTIKDKEGYLVTKEEPAWESFSEDEPRPQSTRREGPVASTASSAIGKGKQASGTPGQGDIMSFFGKRT